MSSLEQSPPRHAWYKVLSIGLVVLLPTLVLAGKPDVSPQEHMPEFRLSVGFKVLAVKTDPSRGLSELTCPHGLYQSLCES
jgi:hypothetical protein